MGSKYEVQYWDYYKCRYVISGRFDSFRKAKRAAKKLCKDWYCVTIVMRLKDN